MFVSLGNARGATVECDVDSAQRGTEIPLWKRMGAIHRCRRCTSDQAGRSAGVPSLGKVGPGKIAAHSTRSKDAAFGPYSGTSFPLFRPQRVFWLPSLFSSKSILRRVRQSPDQLET